MTVLRRAVCDDDVKSCEQRHMQWAQGKIHKLRSVLQKKDDLPSEEMSSAGLSVKMYVCRSETKT